MTYATQIVLYGVPLSALIVALVALFRYQGMPSHYAPAASLALGILGGLAAQYHVYQMHGTPDYLFGVISGVVLGLTASGLYSHSSVYLGQAAVQDTTQPTPTAPPAPKPTPAPVVPPAVTPAEPPVA